MSGNVAYIGNLTVRSKNNYIVYGSVRGLVSEHRTQSGAEKSLSRDQSGCRSHGGYSDASVYEWTGDGWTSRETQSGISTRQRNG
jgi:hypothetical protein